MTRTPIKKTSESKYSRIFILATTREKIVKILKHRNRGQGKKETITFLVDKAIDNLSK